MNVRDNEDSLLQSLLYHGEVYPFAKFTFNNDRRFGYLVHRVRQWRKQHARTNIFIPYQNVTCTLGRYKALQYVSGFNPFVQGMQAFLLTIPAVTLVVQVIGS